MIQPAQTGADQSHVVIKWQPTDKDIAGIDCYSLAHGAQVGQQVSMSEHDAFGVAGAAGGVLQLSLIHI